MNRRHMLWCLGHTSIRVRGVYQKNAKNTQFGFVFWQEYAGWRVG